MSVVVFAESIDGKFKKSSLEAVYYGCETAKLIGGETIAVSIGDVAEADLQELGTYGADKVIQVTDSRLNTFVAQAYSEVLEQVANSQNASVVVISNTYSGKAVAPRVAVKLQAGLASGVVSLPSTDNGFVVKRPVFSGKAFAEVSISTEKKVIAITANSFSPTTADKQAAIESFTPELSDAAFGTQSVEVNRVTGKIPLTEAERVVSGGRGLKGPENWGLIEDLANALTAATACSKPVSDMDWRPHSEHVGQTGITIKPNLYIAAGISGAIQHLAGVSSSKVIVAINKDPEAPFFKVADYGIVGDAFEVLPRLTKAARELNSANQ